MSTENVTASFYNASKLLGGYLQREPILGQTACMGAEEREVVATLMAIKDLWPLLTKLDVASMDFNEFLDKIVLPLTKALGYANWPRDVITDMAIFRGNLELIEKCRKEEGVKE